MQQIMANNDLNFMFIMRVANFVHLPALSIVSLFGLCGFRCGSSVLHKMHFPRHSNELPGEAGPNWAGPDDRHKKMSRTDTRGGGA